MFWIGPWLCITKKRWEKEFGLFCESKGINGDVPLNSREATGMIYIELFKRWLWNRYE